jgi:hypothetical protein
MASNYAETAVMGLNPTIVAADVVVGDFPRCSAGVSMPAAAIRTSGLPSYEGRVHCLPAALVHDTPDTRPPSQRGSIGTQQQQQQQQSNNDDQTILSRVPGLARDSHPTHNNTGVAVVTPAQFAGVDPPVNLGETPLFTPVLPCRPRQQRPNSKRE